ncbi:MAG: DUF1559 domain-containing protein [Pirellula sp.]
MSAVKPERLRFGVRRARAGLSRGASLVEVIFVIGIVGVLISLLLPAINAAREAARRVDCSNRMRQIALGLVDHKLANRYLPSGTFSDQTATPWSAWRVRILPRLDAPQLYLDSEAQFRLGVPFQSHSGFKTQIANLVCPSDGRIAQPRFGPRKRYFVALSSFLGVNGTNDTNRDGVLFIDSRVGDRDIGDGLSQTLMFAERPPSTFFDYGWWYAGLGVGRRGTLDHTMGVDETSSNRFATCPEGPWTANLRDECSANHFWSLHGDFANASFCDGAVRTFSFRDEKVASALATRWNDEISEIDSE